MSLQIKTFAGLIDLAIRRNSLIGGDDFKSGQTKMKSVLVDFLVGAGIKVCMFPNKFDEMDCFMF